MEIVYTSHLEFRLKVRNVRRELPRHIFVQAQEHYFDKQTHHYIALHSSKFKGKEREMIVIYDKIGNKIELISIHPLKPYQKLSRIHSGRWQII